MLFKRDIQIKKKSKRTFYLALLFALFISPLFLLSAPIAENSHIASSHKQCFNSSRVSQSVVTDFCNVKNFIGSSFEVQPEISAFEIEDESTHKNKRQVIAYTTLLASDFWSQFAHLSQSTSNKSSSTSILTLSTSMRLSQQCIFRI